MRRLTFLLLCLFIGIGVATAQTMKITGNVISSEDQQPVIGAAVVVKGTTIGTVTDFEGNFSLDVPRDAKMIFISYVGLKTKEVPVASVINVVLDSDSKALDEVVVTAMGLTREKKALGYALQEVKSDELTKAGQQSLATSLSGKIAGVQITSQGGQVGASQNIVVRGNSSFGNNQPLIVVDGVPIANDNAKGATVNLGSGLNDINPEDIESISVLKGGSAALYGMRAGNGVILVTTKKGKGKTTVDYGFNMRFTTNGIMAFSPSMQEYASMWLEANKEMPEHDWWGWGEENLKKMAQGIEGIYESTVADWGTMFVGNANRLDELFARRYSYQHNLSVAGSTDKSDYRISLAYADNQANLATAYDGQKQLNLRLNYGIKLTDWFKLETLASMIKTNTETWYRPYTLRKRCSVFPGKKSLWTMVR